MDGKHSMANGREQQQQRVLGKRPFGMIVDENQQREHHEEKESLVALVKRRLEDVLLLENEISYSQAKLAAKRKAYEDAKAGLATLEAEYASVKSGKMSEKCNSHHNAGQQNDNDGFEVLWEKKGAAGNAYGGGNGGISPVGSRMRGQSSPSPLHGRTPTAPAPRAPRPAAAAATTSPTGGDTLDANRYPAQPAKVAAEHAGWREAAGSPGIRREKAQSDYSGLASNVDGRTRSESNKLGGVDPVLQKKAAVAKTSIPQQPQQQNQRRQKHVELIPSVARKDNGQPLSFSSPNYSSSQHRRKMRCLLLNPSSENQCVTSGLDGVVNFWQIHPKSLDINFRYSVDCLSGQRHWPEDLAWHPDGQSIFAVYAADNGDSQVSIIKNDNEQKNVKFLKTKPHVKSVMNGIAFMPWSSSLFVTGGNDHMVNLWRERPGEVDDWRGEHLHSVHTSAVTGVAGLQQRHLVLSAGTDKRVLGYDLDAGKVAFRHELDNRAMNVLPNPVDANLVMVHTGHGGQENEQLHLFDIRASSRLHYFGWKQESSASQSALITQSWSPDGYYVASGSIDPKISIFDIRSCLREPAQTIDAHTKRVFMAVWHQTLPMLLSISSDLFIGLHRIKGS